MGKQPTAVVDDPAAVSQSNGVVLSEAFDPRTSDVSNGFIPYAIPRKDDPKRSDQGQAAAIRTIVCLQATALALSAVEGRASDNEGDLQPFCLFDAQAARDRGNVLFQACDHHGAAYTLPDEERYGVLSGKTVSRAASMIWGRSGTKNDRRKAVVALSKTL